jgi:regulator of RNase E activity RraA
MATEEDKKLIEELKKYNTPQITNVVATYPTAPTCLGLYNPWQCNWYTDISVKTMFPDLGRTVGYAVTCIFGESDPNYTGKVGWCDVLDVIEKSPKPCILVLKHQFPEKIKNKVGLIGGNMCTHMTTLGCVGVVCDGPARDMDEIRPMNFQVLCTGTSPGHGQQDVYAINVPVHVAGMDVCPGEIVHMDEHGATKFPADKLSAVAENCRVLQAEEDDTLARVRKCKSSNEIRKILTGHSYGDQDAKKRKKK